METVETLDTSPFKKLVLTIGGMPTAFMESMTYYEALAWLVNYIENTVIPAVNNNAGALEELQTAFVTLKNYVDHYFDNLDVQEEIDHKLDEMVQDGTLKSILNSQLLTEINNKVLQNTVDISANTEAIAGKVSQGEASSITMEMLTQEVREALTGGSTAVVAEDSVDNENIVDGAVSIFKLDDVLKSSKIITYGNFMDLGNESAGIPLEDSTTHKVRISGPTSTDYHWYKVAVTKGKFYMFTGYTYGSCGIMLADSEDNVIFNSISEITYTVNPYSVIIRPNEDDMNVYIGVGNFTYAAGYESMVKINTPNLREVDLIVNKIKTLSAKLLKTNTGYYCADDHIGEGAVAVPKVKTYANTNVLVYAMDKGVRYHVNSYAWSSVCGLYLLKADNTIIYQSTDSPVGDEYVNVDYTFTAAQDGFIVVHTFFGGHTPTVEVVNDIPTSGSSSEITFSKWFALGDSLTETNFRASDNYVSYIADELDITAVNLGHSGAGYMKANQSSTTIRSEIAEISGYNYNTDIITVMGSINDWEYIENDLGELGDTGTDTLYGCIYNFFSGLQTAYMGTRLGVITLPPAGTNRTTFYAKAALYNTAIKETAALFDVPVLDLTESCNLKPWESNFRNEFFSADGTGGAGQVDDTHPNSKGHWLIHSKIKEFLKSL